MKNHILFIMGLLLIMFSGCSIDDPEPQITSCPKPLIDYPETLLGLHGTMDAATAEEFDAEVLRFGFPDYKIKNAYLQANSEDFINNIKTLHNNGVEIVTYLRWPEDTIELVGADYERIPKGADKDEVFFYLEKYLTDVGPFVDWIQINQEPSGVTPYHEEDAEEDPETGLIPALEWWKEVAEFICEKREQSNDLAHLKIMSPGITGVKNLVRNDGPDADFDEQPITASVIDNIIDFSENYCDAIDIHLHTESVELGSKEIAYIRERTHMPLATTEWSQAHAAKSTGWLDDINPVYNASNRHVMTASYNTPMTPEMWQEFMENGPQTPGFIPSFFQVLQENNFVLACYGGAYQYGSPAYDWKMLWAQKTVNPSVKNQPFYDEYVSIK